VGYLFRVIKSFDAMIIITRPRSNYNLKSTRNTSKKIDYDIISSDEKHAFAGLIKNCWKLSKNK
jgi:hypothetical protein